GEFRAADDPVIQPFAPANIDGSVKMSGSFGPEGAHGIVGGHSGLVAEGGQDVMGRTSVIERRDQRLNNGRGAVVSASIAPRFQVMRFGNMPVAIGGSLVEVRAKVNSSGNALELGNEIEVVFFFDNTATTENEQQIDFACIHIGAKLA